MFSSVVQNILRSVHVQVLRCGFIQSNEAYLLTTSQCFTILWQEPGIQALQVLNAHNEWINAPPIPGTLVIKCDINHLLLAPIFNYAFCSLGDQLARWTSKIAFSIVYQQITQI